MGRGQTNKSILSFNAGELSPKLDARMDLDKYSAGCRTLENAFVESYGAAVRRAGTQYIASTKVAGTKSRLTGFRFSTTTNFMLEFGVGYIRFFSNGAQVLDAGVPVEVAAPYGATDVFEIQTTQINDVVYIAHVGWPTYKLSRLSDIAWTLTKAEFYYPPLLDENLEEDDTLSLDGTTLTANFDAFLPGHVGSYWQIAHLREASFVELEIVADATSDTIPIRGDWVVRTYGVWIADVLVQRSLDDGTTWNTIRKFRGKEDRNVDATGTQVEDAIFRVVLENYAAPADAGPTTPRVVIEAVDAYVYGLVKVTEVTSATEAEVTVIDAALSTDATAYWAEGAWSDVRGYPRAVTLHEQRLCFGGSTYQPQTVWGSVIGDFENFKRGTNDTDSFAYTLGATEFNAILWFVSQGRLLIGTTAGEWTMWSGDQGIPITPTQVKVDQQSSYGSEPGVSALLVNDLVLFVQRQGRKVREFAFSYEKDGYVAPDLTLLSEHVTKGGIVQLAYQGGEETSMLWAVTATGNLIAMTYQREQNVAGWHRHPTDGFVESVATIYGGADDEVWMVVRRTVNSATVRYVERINPSKWTDKANAFFVDCGKTILMASSTAVTGLLHLRGKTVHVLANGNVELPKVVSATGTITLDNASTKVQVGLPFTTTIKPMRIDTDPVLGNSQGVVKQVRNLVLRFLNTLGGKYGDGKGAYENIIFRDTDDVMDSSPALFTGDKEVQFPGEFETEGDIVIVQDQPLPLTLLAIVVKHQVTGK